MYAYVTSWKVSVSFRLTKVSADTNETFGLGYGCSSMDFFYMCTTNVCSVPHGLSRDRVICVHLSDPAPFLESVSLCFHPCK